jgi:hypothetical protein
MLADCQLPSVVLTEASYGTPERPSISPNDQNIALDSNHEFCDNCDDVARAIEAIDEMPLALIRT